MASSNDPESSSVAGKPRPFVVSHPCPVCHGEGAIDEHVCRECYGTGVGRFYHGTKADLKPGDVIEPKRSANFGKPGRSATFVYFTGTLDAATWGAELALGDGPGRIYIVEPNGPIEDDPNLTDKKFPGNPTKSYRSREPLPVLGEFKGWQGHSAEQLKAMKDGLAELERRGVQPIDE